MADDDHLHTLNTVHADDRHVRPHHELPFADVDARAEPPAKAPAIAAVSGCQQYEYAPTSRQRGSGRGEGEIPAACHDQIHGPDHWVGTGSVRPPTRTGPLKVRRNASSWRNSIGRSRSGRNSL